MFYGSIYTFTGVCIIHMYSTIPIKLYIIHIYAASQLHNHYTFPLVATACVSSSYIATYEMHTDYPIRYGKKTIYIH